MWGATYAQRNQWTSGPPERTCSKTLERGHAFEGHRLLQLGVVFLISEPHGAIKTTDLAHIIPSLRASRGKTNATRSQQLHNEVDAAQ